MSFASASSRGRSSTSWEQRVILLSAPLTALLFMAKARLISVIVFPWYCITITLGEHFDAFVNEKIAEGRFQSVSEAVRAGLRRLEEDECKLEALRAKLQAGEHSPLVEGFSPQRFLAEMRCRSAK